MEIVYIAIAAVIIVLPFILSRVFSGSTRDTKTVLGSPAAAPGKTRAPAGRSNLLSEEVKVLLAHGKKIEAIKVVRERTGFPLEAAKDMVDMIGKAGAVDVVETLEHGSVAEPVERTIADMLRLARELTPEVQRLIKEGRKIEAIQLVHRRTGIGLQEAKTIVDRLA